MPDWGRMSLDLNAIEHVQNVLKRKLYENDHTQIFPVTVTTNVKNSISLQKTKTAIRNIDFK